MPNLFVCSTETMPMCWYRNNDHSAGLHMADPASQLPEIVVDVLKYLERTQQVKVIVIDVLYRDEHRGVLRESRTSHLV
jgi:hypothetical protein